MYELTYRSKARKDITQKEIEQILNIAKIRNRDKNISGCLIYHNNVFLQILEGEEEDVLFLFDKIKLDIRHSASELIWKGPSVKRFFPNWEMAFHHADQHASQDEIFEFEQNLSMFSRFCDKPTAAARLFWNNVSLLLQKGTPSRMRSV